MNKTHFLTHIRSQRTMTKCLINCVPETRETWKRDRQQVDSSLELRRDGPLLTRVDSNSLNCCNHCNKCNKHPENQEKRGREVYRDEEL